MMSEFNGSDSFQRLVVMNNRAFARRRKDQKQRNRLLPPVEAAPPLIQTFRPDRQAFVASAFDALPEAVLVVDDKGGIFDCNDAALRLLACNRADLQSLSPLDLHDASIQSRPGLNPPVRDNDFQGVLQIRRRDGSVLRAESLARFVEVDGARMLVAVLRDAVSEGEAAAQDL